jgi:hypothetical protein
MTPHADLLAAVRFLSARDIGVLPIIIAMITSTGWTGKSEISPVGTTNTDDKNQ